MNMAHVHLMLNHLPVIGFLLFVPVIVWAFLQRTPSSLRFVLVTGMILGCLTLPSFYSGEAAEDALEQDISLREDVLDPHEEAAELALVAGVATGGLSLGLLLLSFWRALPASVTFGLLLLAVLLTNGAMGWTAYLGGQIRHSEIHRPLAQHSSGGESQRSVRTELHDEDD